MLKIGLAGTGIIAEAHKTAILKNSELTKMLKDETNEIVTPEIGRRIIAVNEKTVNMI